MESNVYFNGRIMPAADAAIGIDDAGFLHGASTFTTMLANHGKVFRLDRHLQRLFETVRLVSLRTNHTPEMLTAAVTQLLQANGLAPGAGAEQDAGDDARHVTATQGRVRITLTPGSVHGGEPTTLITAEPLPPYPREWYENGITVVVSSLKQASGDPTFGYKTGCYLPRVLGRQESAAKGADEALWFTNDNRLAEACFCNVFLALDGKVFTPPRDTPVLPGIVRQATIELCAQLDIPCEADKPLTVKEMLAAGEVFLTGSTTGIRPVARIERHAVGDQKPGPITKRLMAAYAELVEVETR